MEDRNPKWIARGYKIRYWVFFGALVFLALMANYSIDFSPIAYLLVYGAVIVLSMLFVVFCYNRYITSVLTKEFSPELYKQVLIEGELISRAATERINATFYTGDYQKTIDIVYDRMKDEKCSKFKPFYLITLARIYFELADDESLRRVCEEFETYAASSKSPAKIWEKYMVMKFYSAYSKGEPLCRAEYEKLMNNKKKMKSVWFQVHARYTYAVILYLEGEKEAALNHFNYVIGVAEGLNIAGISKGYVEAIKKGKEYNRETVILRPTEDYKFSAYKRITKKNRKKAVIGLAAYLAAAITLLGGVKIYNDVAKAKYEKAVAEHYSEFEIIDTVSLIKNREVVATITLCNTETDGIVIGSTYEYEDKKGNIFMPIVTNVDINGITEFTCEPTSSLKVKAEFVSDAAKIKEKYLCASPITINGEKYYFCVTEAEKESK